MSVFTSPSDLPASTPASARRSPMLVEGDGGVVRWEFRRNCSLSPRQLMAFFAGMSAVSLTIATFFWVQGARMVMPFAWLELLTLGAALLFHARHVGDRERIELDGARLSVEQTCGSRVDRAEFVAAWVKVEARGRGSALVELSDRGRTVAVGRFLRPEGSRQLATELRTRLRAVHLGRVPAGDVC